MSALVEFVRDLVLQVAQTQFFQGLGLEIAGLLVFFLGISIFKRVKL